MRRFDFRLQRVMEVRGVKKKECQRDLARSQEELNRQEQMLSQAADELKSSHEGLRKALKNRCSAGLLAALEHWRSRREEALHTQSQRTARQRHVVEERREVLITAAKDEKVLERLREHALEEHRTESLREEQSFLDELGCRIGRIWKYPPKDKKME